MGALTGSISEGLCTGDVVRVSERGRASQVGRQLRGLRMKGAQDGDVSLELTQHLFRIDGHLLLEEGLDPGGAESLAFPAEDCGSDLGAPRIHLLRYRRRDFRQEIAELVR